MRRRLSDRLMAGGKGRLKSLFAPIAVDALADSAIALQLASRECFYFPDHGRWQGVFMRACLIRFCLHATTPMRYPICAPVTGLKSAFRS